jgi:short subunit dehydrogenase-like uncharacterized protein
MKSGILLYGANGYTGRLILDELKRLGLEMTIAGRSRAPLEALASSRGVAHRVFTLEDPARVAEELAPYAVLLLAAGPFSATSRPAFDACLEARTSYLDITGEIDVFEALFARDAEAKAAGITAVPGVGFDVVPTDALAALLAKELPGAVRLELAFRGGRTSVGTKKTMMVGIPKGGRARVNGRLVRVPLAWKTMTARFPDKERTAVTIPWGDVATAWRSTGIPNIETYLAMAPSAIAGLKRMRFVAPLAGLSPVQAFLKARAGATGEGPDEDQRKRERSLVWGRVTAADGTTVEGTLESVEGYTLTAQTSARAARHLLAGDAPHGVLTPSLAFGPRFVEEVAGTVIRIGAAAGTSASATPRR